MKSDHHLSGTFIKEKKACLFQTSHYPVSDPNSSDCSKPHALILVSHILGTRDDNFFNKNFPDQFYPADY